MTILTNDKWLPVTWNHNYTNLDFEQGECDDALVGPILKAFWNVDLDCLKICWVNRTTTSPTYLITDSFLQSPPVQYIKRGIGRTRKVPKIANAFSSCIFCTTPKHQ